MLRENLRNYLQRKKDLPVYHPDVVAYEVLIETENL